jgi:hypothetical protein
MVLCSLHGTAKCVEGAQDKLFDRKLLNVK